MPYYWTGRNTVSTFWGVFEIIIIVNLFKLNGGLGVSRNYRNEEECQD